MSRLFIIIILTTTVAACRTSGQYTDKTTESIDLETTGLRHRTEFHTDSVFFHTYLALDSVEMDILPSPDTTASVRKIRIKARRIIIDSGHSRNQTTTAASSDSLSQSGHRTETTVTDIRHELSSGIRAYGLSMIIIASAIVFLLSLWSKRKS